MTILYKLFPMTLENEELNWLNDLKPRSITSLGVFGRVFVERYAHNCAPRKDVESLCLIHQKNIEEISAFVSSFIEEVADINASERTPIRAFKGALNANEKQLFEYVQVHKPHTLNELISHLEDYVINIEERRIRDYNLV